MPSFDIVRNSRAKKTFRVASVMGRYDLTFTKIKESFVGSIPIEKQDWQIGVIYGRSGTGKSTIAKELFGDAVIDGFTYTKESVLDDFDDKNSVEDITKAFVSVGFSSVPSWLKPYNVLSTGEKMRVDLARSLMSEQDLVVFDEYTSVVDRDIAKVGSLAVSKAIRRADKRFIAVTCHSDISDWLSPDWIFCTDNMSFEWTRGRHRRPEIKIDVYRCKGFWEHFKKYHYLKETIGNSSRRYVGFYGDKPVAFVSATIHPLSNGMRRYIIRIERVVVLPAYQGIGIGGRMLDAVCQMFYEAGERVSLVTSHYALNRHWQHSPDYVLRKKCRKKNHGGSAMNNSGSGNRIIASWEYVKRSNHDNA